MSDEVLRQRVTMIQRMENDKEQEATMKARNKLALQAAKKVSQEAYDAEKARIANEKLALAEAKKKAQLEATVAKQAEKRRQQAAKKAQNVSNHLLNYHTHYSLLGIEETQGAWGGTCRFRPI